jgi:hypothetical protein
MPRENPSRTVLQLCAPPALTVAVKNAAAREMTTISEYVRRVLIDRLRSDGIDPGEIASRQPASGVNDHAAA